MVYQRDSGFTKKSTGHGSQKAWVLLGAAIFKLRDPGKPSSNFLTCKLGERIANSELRLNEITRY